MDTKKQKKEFSNDDDVRWRQRTDYSLPNFAQIWTRLHLLVVGGGFGVANFYPLAHRWMCASTWGESLRLRLCGYRRRTSLLHSVFVINHHVVQGNARVNDEWTSALVKDAHSRRGQVGCLVMPLRRALACRDKGTDGALLHGNAVDALMVVHNFILFCKNN